MRSIEQIVADAMLAATGGDWSALMGRCTEAAIIGFAALADRGFAPVMVSGSYVGPKDDSAAEYFGGDQHSWIECDGRIFDPTRWVFRWEAEDPAVFVGSADDPAYVGSLRLTTWQQHYTDHLRSYGFAV